MQPEPSRKARCTKLDRDVAIKVLPPDLASDPDRVKRFEREAKAIAALDHPNIVTVYSVEESDGLRFITMQLVLGKTLSEMIPKKGMLLGKFFDLAVPLADAIGSAHEQGIAHRDLKPANIMVTAEGRVEILDFGLAKLMPQTSAERSTQMPEPSLTGEGQIVGTVAYMSPEQAEGRDVDHRTDIFSLGIILYEMVTGVRPFTGDSRIALMSSIIRDTPTAVRKVNPHVPNHLGRIIRRCLEKDPERRFQTAKDLRNDLDDLKSEVSSGEAEVVPARPDTRAPFWSWIAIVFLAALVGVLTQQSGVETQANPLFNTSPTPLTNFPGDELGAAISLDGSMYAFLSDEEGTYDVWIGQIGGSGLPSNRTRGSLGDIRPPASVKGVGFTHDRNLWTGPIGEAPMQFLPLLGGPAQNALGPEAVSGDWLQDGSIVYQTREDGDPLYVRRAGEDPKVILPADDERLHQHQPVWSLDGSWVYFIRGRPDSGDTALWRVRPDGSDLSLLTTGVTYVEYPAPISEDTVLFVARDADGAGPWIWAIDVETLEILRASIGVEQYTSLSASKDGRRLVATRANPEVYLNQVPIPSNPNEVATERDVTAFGRVSTIGAYAPRFVGPDLYYLSSPGTGDRLWKHTDGQDEAFLMRDEGAVVEPPAISRDGRVALIIRQEGRLTLQVITDGEPLYFTRDIEVRGTPSWSPTGEWIAIGGVDDDGPGLFKVRVSDGEIFRLTEKTGVDPVWSPDPKRDLIFYSGSQADADWCPRQSFPLWAIRSDGSSVEIPQISLLRRGERIRFLPNGSGLVYMQGMLPSQDFHLLDPDTMVPRRLTQLDPGAAMRTFDVTPDGKSIVFDRRREHSDVVLIDLVNGR